MHSRHTLIKARFTAVRNDLEENLARMSPEMMGWAPAEGMRTIAGQLVEIIGTEIQLIALLRDAYRISDPDAREFIGDCNNFSNLKRALNEVRAETLAYLDSLTEADLAEEVEFEGGWLAH